MTCPERDKMLLAFALAVNERNIASSDLETAADDVERRQLHRYMQSAAGQSEQLRALVLLHFAEHCC
jgi:hypothetical protein